MKCVNCEKDLAPCSALVHAGSGELSCIECVQDYYKGAGFAPNTNTFEWDRGDYIEFDNEESNVEGGIVWKFCEYSHLF